MPTTHRITYSDSVPGEPNQYWWGRVTVTDRFDEEHYGTLQIGDDTYPVMSTNAGSSWWPITDAGLEAVRDAAQLVCDDPGTITGRNQHLQHPDLHGPVSSCRPCAELNNQLVAESRARTANGQATEIVEPDHGTARGYRWHMNERRGWTKPACQACKQGWADHKRKERSE